MDNHDSIQPGKTAQRPKARKNKGLSRAHYSEIENAAADRGHPEAKEAGEKAA